MYIAGYMGRISRQRTWKEVAPLVSKNPVITLERQTQDPRPYMKRFNCTSSLKMSRDSQTIRRLAEILIKIKMSKKKTNRSIFLGKKSSSMCKFLPK